MYNNAIIIFIKNPEAGKVKTRLAKEIGDEKTLEVYKKLLDHTRKITQELAVEKYLYYSDSIDDNDQWPIAYYNKRLQSGADLGERMQHAFNEVIAFGHSRVTIIGSDCYELTKAILAEAFKQLATHNAVLGPANDGGYYLLGMNNLWPAYFAGIVWSTDTVCRDTIANIERQGHSVYILPELSDVDQLKDVPKEWL